VSFLTHIPLALDGQWSGAGAIAIVMVAALIFIGSIYYILSTLFGWRRAYYVVVISLMGFLIILSLVWLLGIPGTGPGFGPRGREAAYIPFLPNSQFASDFKTQIQAFPDGSGWDQPGKKYFGNGDTKQTGALDSIGEIDTYKLIIEPALAGYFQKNPQLNGSIDPADYDFRRQLPPADDAKLTADQKVAPIATIRYADGGGGRLLVGLTIPGTAKHPQITVFALRDKGTIFVPALEFLVSAVLLFALHLWLLARDEVKQKMREAETATSVTAPTKITT
jgi:hypothetical protein